MSNGGARGLGRGARGVRHALRAARAWRTEKPTVLLVTETNFWYLLIRLPFLPAKVASFLVEVLACHGAQSRRRRQLADSESGPARGKGAAGAGEARAGGGGQGTRAIVVFGLVWVLCFLYKRTRFKNTTSYLCFVLPQTQAARLAWGCGTHKTSQEECPGSPCRVLLMRLCWQMLASPPPLLSFSRRVCSHFLRAPPLRCAHPETFSTQAHLPCSSGRQRA